MNEIDELEDTPVRNGTPPPTATLRAPRAGGFKHTMTEENDLRRYWKMLRAQWLIIAATAMTMALAVFAVSLLQPTRYDSSAKLGWTNPNPTDTGLNDSAKLNQIAARIASPTVLALASDALKMSAVSIQKQCSASPDTTSNTVTVSCHAATANRAQQITQEAARAGVLADKQQDISRLQADREQLRLNVDKQQKALRATVDQTTKDAANTALTDLQKQLNDVQTQLEVLQNPKAKGYKQSALQTIDTASLPKAPTEPQPTRNAFIGLLAGLLFGCAAAVVRDRLDRRLRTMDEVEAAFNLPMLGVVPQVSAAARGQRRSGRVDFARSSRIADAYRTIRTNLTLYGIDQSGDHKVVVVTSALPAEGKSGAVANISTSFATAGLKVLAISADLRAPALHEYFDEQFGDSLIDVLSGELRLSAAVRSQPISASMGRREGLLHLLANDKRFPDPAVLYGSPAMVKLLAEARRRYDIIVIDTPPVLSAGETPLLARLADATLIVTNLQVANKDAARRAMQVLSGADIHPIGMIATSPPDTSADSGFGYGYGYGTTETEPVAAQ